jgi:two-component system phosphate regulon sensor histidine kinase PhoR
VLGNAGAHVIQANSETLAAGAMEDPEQARVFLDAVRRNADRLAQIIADLLDLSRIEAGEYNLDLGSVELGPVARRVIHNLEESACKKRLTIDLDMPAHASVHADAHAIEQIILNLLDNAVKYSDEGGHVTLRAVPADTLIRIHVEDDGPGIDRRHRARVFERFYRVDPGRSRAVGGTGLGLAIVKHLVDSMGGDVGLEPRSPRGSVFWFSLPRAR